MIRIARPFHIPVVSLHTSLLRSNVIDSEKVEVLVADDDPIVLERLETNLESWNYSVSTVDNGKDALNVLTGREHPHIAILNWMMPGLSGTDVCRRIRAQKPDVPLYIIIHTARTDREDLIEGLDSGADDYIFKPFDGAVLKARVAVGKRYIEAQRRIERNEKLEGALEMAGAVCHELNQPLQIVLGYAELLVSELNESHPAHQMAVQIKNTTKTMGDLTRRLMKITKYKTKTYLAGRSTIFDLSESDEEYNGTRDPTQT